MKEVQLPQNTKFVAFHYTSSYKYYTVIDDIFITQISNTPEIALTSISAPSYVGLQDTFEVTGTVCNNSSVPLTSFTGSCTFCGNTVTDNITGLNVATNGSSTFTLHVPATQPGRSPITVQISNPNGEPDYAADNLRSDTVLVCSSITAPYTQDFESGMACWRVVSLNTDNESNTGLRSYFTAHSGTYYFQFSSYYSADDYTQYLISPELDLTEPVALSFYAKDLYDYGREKILIGYSTTDDSPTSFAMTGDTIEVWGSWMHIDTLVPADVKYITIKYVTRGRYETAIDDIALNLLPQTPEIALTAISIPYMATANSPFAVEGTIVNNSAVSINSFTASFVVAGDSISHTFTGLDVPYAHEYRFQMPPQATVSDSGTFVLSLSVSQPNGTADNVADNSATAQIEIYAPQGTVRRKTLLEHFSTASCPNCIDGHRRLETAMEQGFEDDIVWVTHHSGYHEDRLTIDASETLTDLYNDRGNTYAPAIMLDRTYFGDFEFAQGIGVPPGPVFFPYTGLITAFSTALSIPAYVEVRIDALQYDSASRLMSVTVGGEVLSAIDAVSPRLNVWLLEDGIIADGGTDPGHGPTQAYGDSTFLHNHVIREVLNNGTWGEENIVSSADAQKTITLYPNPATSQLNIAGIEKAATYAVYAMNGRKVLAGTTDGTIDVSNLSAGLYIIELEIDGTPLRQRFAVK